MTKLFLFSWLLLYPLGTHAQSTPSTSASEHTPALSSQNVGVQPLLPTVSTNGAARPPLSLQQALALARQSVPTIEAARARVEAAQARLQGARARPNPTLALALPFGVTGTRGATGGFDEGIVASQLIEGPGKRSARTRSAQGERDSALYDLAGSGTTLDFTVRSAYFDALRAQSDRDVDRTTFEGAQEFLRATNEQEQAGDVPRRDVLRAQTESDRAASALVQSEADLNTRLQILVSLTGLPEGTVPQLSDALTFPPVRFDVDTLARFALERRADVQSARATLEARTADIQSAKAARRPDFFVEARDAQILPQAGDVRGTSLRIGISLPLFDYGSLKQGIAVANAGAKEQQYNLAETQRTARLDVLNVLQTLEAARLTVESFQNGRLQRAQTLLDLARTGYAEGASSLLDVLDARNVYRAEQADYNRALASYNTALADVQRSVGGTLPFNGTSPSGSSSANTVSALSTITPQGTLTPPSPSAPIAPAETAPTTPGGVVTP